MARVAKKLFYKIGEVCRIFEVEPHVLRYWETEFSLLSPTKNNSGQRIYRQRDLELIETIKRLLYEEGYTIAGANKKLLENGQSAGNKKKHSSGKALTPTQRSLLDEIKKELKDILNILGR